MGPYKIMECTDTIIIDESDQAGTRVANEFSWNPSPPIMVLLMKMAGGFSISDKGIFFSFAIS